MKKAFYSILVAVIVISLASPGSRAQEFSLKKDVILKDKVPYAKLSGESSLTKETDLTVSSLNDNPLFTIKAWKYPTRNPAFQHLSGVKIEFLASGNSVIRSNMPYNKNKLINEVFHFWSDLIVNNAIDPKAEKDYVDKFDNGELYLASEYEKAESEYLKKMLPMSKDPSAPVSVTLIKETKTPEGSIIQETEIYQGSDYLMSMKKLWTSKWKMTFYRKVDEAMEVNDKAYKEIKIATLTVPNFVLTTGSGSSLLYTNMDTTEREIKIANLKEAEIEVAKYLIENKYL